MRWDWGCQNVNGKDYEKHLNENEKVNAEKDPTLDRDKWNCWNTLKNKFDVRFLVNSDTLCKKGQIAGFFQAVFSCIRIEYAYLQGRSS